MVAFAAGASVSAQPSNTPAPGATAVASTVDFRSSKWLSDRKVVNTKEEEIASVSDLILNRGSGRIEYVIVKTGTTLGMGGRAVAIPYASFRWEAAGKDRFVLASTEDQLKQFPEFSAETWKGVKQSKVDEKNTLHQRLAADAASPSDPYAGNLDTAKKARIEGEVTKVDRVRTGTFGEQVEVTVKTTDGATKRVALGPSWYINGASAAPMRGDKVVVDTLVLPRDPNQLLAGTHLKTGDRELHLRDSDGSPAWALKTVESGGESYSTPFSRYLLLSDLPGKKIVCRGEDCGKVQDVIIDRNSGEIGFLSIDPNQNFLGVGDTKRLVPWSVATVTLDGNVRIDASKEMVLASPETPSDLKTLNSGTHAEQAYKAFNVPAPKFEAPKPISGLNPDNNSAWSARGPIIGAIERNSSKTFAGKVTDLTEVKFGNGVQPAKALKMKVDSGSEEVVLLGPASYMENQKASCKTGDSVKVDVVRTTVDGHQYWIAKSIDCKDSRVVLLDGSNDPVWAQP